MQVCPNCGEENPERFRLCGFCGTPLAQARPPQEVRKTVTIVFSDLKGSTSLGETLDSEALREVMTRYFDEMKVVLEAHGGTIEKFIGDAVMAVFGLPKLHEDDALRAVRAAAEMQRALARLNDDLERRWGVRLANRTGVHTGEVVAGDPTGGQRLVTGDPVNVAARLEQAAGEMEVLIGDLTYRLVRDAVEVEPVEPLSLKGKAEPVQAYRLLSVQESSLVRRHDAPIVGRERELELLVAEHRRAVVEQACRMITVLGDAGVGKSRLTQEFVGAVHEGSLVLRGRCLSYGRGITFWPLVEAVCEAASIGKDDPPELARTKLAALAGEGGDDIAGRVAAAIGLSSAQFPIEELFWGVRKLFETLASEKPLVVVFEDIHWAESTFLDLIEHLTDSACDAPILVLCLARHDLVEHRPQWAEQPNAACLTLEPLTEAGVGLVVENLLGAAGIAAQARKRIIEAAAGNPLFVEQVLSMMIEDGLLREEDGRWTATGGLESGAIPPTINALLAARLDALPREERAVLEAASVIGQVFPLDAVQELISGELGQAESSLAALVRKQFIRPELSALAHESSFRFRHILIRDAAYSGLLKRARATLHERFVAWGDRVNRERDHAIEYEEILGYHLEQAYRYLSELGPLDEHGLEVGAKGAERLSSAGRRAFARGDMPAAANLLRRAVTLLPGEDPARLALLPDLGEALMDVGEFAWAQVYLDEAIEAAARIGNERLGVSAQLMRLLVERHSSESDGWSEQVVRKAEQAIPIFERAEDHEGLARIWRLLGWVYGSACRYGEAAEAALRAVEHARRAGDARQEARGAVIYAAAALYGPTPVPEAIARCDQIVEETSSDRRSAAVVLCFLSHLHAMKGDFSGARDLYGRARATLEDIGGSVLAASTSLDSSLVEMLAGDPEAAEHELRRDYEILDRMGEKFLLSTTAALLAEALYAQGRFAEAGDFSRRAEELASEDDVASQALWRCARAKVTAREGLIGEAEALARDALDVLSPTDAPVLQADALAGLAEVLRLAGREPEARAALEEAVRLSEAKQNFSAAATWRASLAAPAAQPITSASLS